MAKKLITVSSQITDGMPVFAGTRVPVTYLFEHIQAGDTLDDFLDGYPSVTRDHAIAVFEQHQNVIAGRSFSDIVLATKAGRWSELQPLMAELRDTIGRAQPGTASIIRG